MKIHPATMLGVVLLGNTMANQAQNNVLIIVADDLGKEVLRNYNTPTAQKANTPNIDKLAKQGITFDNFWGYPLSAPVRAAMLTGRYGHHTSIVDLSVGTLPTLETTLFEALPESHANALFGKWHLSRDANFAPDYGIDHFEGFAQGGGVRNYYNWQYTKNGSTQTSTEYVTTQITNSAKGWIEDQKSPWVCWVAYNAPHTPLHTPPAGTYTQTLKDDSADMESNPLPYFLAMVENLDYEVGRLLESVDSDNTTIIFVGDNGTENRHLQEPYPSRHGKGSLYEAGVSVPLIVCGNGVMGEGARSSAKVSSVDMFPTIMELSGVEMPSYQDAISFKSVLSGGDGARQFTFSEILNTRLGYMNAISDGRYKLIISPESTMMFDLDKDPLELNDITQRSLTKEERTARKKLEDELDRMNIPKIEKRQTTNRKGGGNGGNRPTNGNRPQMSRGNN